MRLALKTLTILAIIGLVVAQLGTYYGVVIQTNYIAHAPLANVIFVAALWPLVVVGVATFLVVTVVKAK